MMALGKPVVPEVCRQTRGSCLLDSKVLVNEYGAGVAVKKCSTEGNSKIRMGLLARTSETTGNGAEGASMTEPFAREISVVMASAP